MLKKMAHTSLKVSNLECSKRFYTKIIGLEHVKDTANEDYYFSLLKVGDSVIELLESRTKHYETKTTGPIDHIAFWVDDLDDTIEELKSNDIKILMREPKIVGMSKIFFIEGPDKERIELMEDISTII